MKTILIILALVVAGYFWYDHLKDARADKPPVATDPWYLELRATNQVGGREIEMALFARALSERDCNQGERADWASISKACPTCRAQPPRCAKNLPPRYARLFDDVAIPSAYLSASAGAEKERDLRLVVYGLTDQEGVQLCEMMRKELAKTYVGPSHCVSPAPG